MNKAFTLIEVLVVIAIIGLFAAISIPVVGSAKKTGRKIQCANNLKQVTLASVSYSLDKHDPNPSDGINVKVPDIIPMESIFWSELGPYFSVKASDNTSENAAKTIIGDKRSAFCPQSGKNDGVKVGISFGRNTVMAADNAALYTNVSDNPSKTGLIGNVGMGNFDFNTGASEFVHKSNSMNVGFLDGHASLILQNNFPTSSSGTTSIGSGDLTGQNFWTGISP